MISKDQFEKDYCDRSCISRDFYSDNFVTLPCDCGAEDCDGMAAVSNNRLSIKAHKDLYAPKTKEWQEWAERNGLYHIHFYKRSLA